MSTDKKKKTKTTPASKSQSTASADVTFESALEELENIIHNLEQDDLTLDNALSGFERGILLLRVCDNHLNHARGRITELIRSDNGAFAEKILGMSLESFLNEDRDHE